MAKTKKPESTPATKSTNSGKVEKKSKEPKKSKEHKKGDTKDKQVASGPVGKVNVPEASLNPVTAKNVFLVDLQSHKQGLGVYEPFCSNYDLKGNPRKSAIFDAMSKACEQHAKTSGYDIKIIRNTDLTRTFKFIKKKGVEDKEADKTKKVEESSKKDSDKDKQKSA